MRKKRLVETFSLATFGTQIKDSPTYLKDYLCKATKIIKAVNLSQRPCLTNKATPLLIFVPKTEEIFVCEFSWLDCQLCEACRSIKAAAAEIRNKAEAQIWNHDQKKYERSQKSVSREGNLEQVVLSGDQLGASLCCLLVGGGWWVGLIHF